MDIYIIGVDDYGKKTYLEYALSQSEAMAWVWAHLDHICQSCCSYEGPAIKPVPRDRLAWKPMLGGGVECEPFGPRIGYPFTIEIFSVSTIDLADVFGGGYDD